MGEQNYAPQGGGQPAGTQPGKSLAVVALILGILSILDPTLVVGIVLGIVGIILAVLAKKKGFIGGLVTAALVLSIIGLVGKVLLLIICGGGLLALGGIDGLDALLNDLP